MAVIHDIRAAARSAYHYYDLLPVVRKVAADRYAVRIYKKTARNIDLQVDSLRQFAAQHLPSIGILTEDIEARHGNVTRNYCYVLNYAEVEFSIKKEGHA